MKDSKKFFQIVLFVAICGVGGFLLSLTGLSIGWMIGTLLFATFLSLQRPKFIKLPDQVKGIPSYWLNIGQCILGIELGQKMNSSILFTFKENWLMIITMLLLSIAFSLLSGLVLWKYSKLSMVTSFFATAPGGMSTIPGIAEEVGANTGIVSIIQTVRVFLVILTIPVILSAWFGSHNNAVSNPIPNVSSAPMHFGTEQIFWTLVLVLVAIIGYYVGRLLKFPAPWLLGSMVSVAILESSASLFFGYEIIAWWPHELMVFSQIFIGASIGSRFHRSMFSGLVRTLSISSLCTLGFIASMFLCAWIVSEITGISFITSALAFAPGGIAEMTTSAIVLHADSTFVVTVQVLRVIAVCMILPPFFRLLHYWELKKNTQTEASA